MAKKRAKKKAPHADLSQQAADPALLKQAIPIFSDEFHTTTHFYRNNLASLKQHYPELADQVENCRFTSGYRIVPSSTGTPNLYCAKKDLFYYNNSDPLKDAKRQLENLHLKNVKIAVCLGVGLGYEIINFIDLTPELRTRVIILYERELEVFKLACCYTDLSPLISNPNARLFIGNWEKDVYVQLKGYIKKNTLYLYAGAMKPVYHPSSLLLNKDYYLSMMKILTDIAKQTVLDFGNCPEDSLIGVENMLANLSVIIRNPGINCLYDRFKGKPAVIVATGPSLNKNKHLLKGMENRALIISVDASLKLLLEMGIRPHMVTSLERIIQVTRLFEDIPPGELQDIYLAACPVIRREVYDNYVGPKIIVYRAFDHFHWLGVERGMLNIKGSAGNMAFKIAAAMGCDPIILVGQDLALTREGLTHAKGHAFGERQETWAGVDTFEVPGNDGLPITTTRILYSFLKGYEVDVAEYSGTCVNATEGGAFIQGTKVMPLAKVIDCYLREEFNPLEIIRRHLQPVSETEVLDTARQVFAKADRTSVGLAKISDICKKALNVIEDKRHLLTITDGSVPPIEVTRQLLDTIYKNKQLCSAHYETFQLFFMHIAQSFNIKFEMEMHALGNRHDSEESELAEIAVRHAEWFGTIGRLADICRDALLKYREKLSFEFPNI
ncbi:MAG: hypothetical protein A4E52_00875 [Pelotomaculum sp. PtaB.Bin013]|nr:MAG: hypothetical protein A4E52_00875 [Pelotomaculum sp. PtaB.Bin013]